MSFDVLLVKGKHVNFNPRKSAVRGSAKTHYNGFVFSLLRLEATEGTRIWHGHWEDCLIQNAYEWTQIMRMSGKEREQKRGFQKMSTILCVRDCYRSLCVFNDEESVQCREQRTKKMLPLGLDAVRCQS